MEIECAQGAKALGGREDKEKDAHLVLNRSLVTVLVDLVTDPNVKVSRVARIRCAGQSAKDFIASVDRESSWCVKNSLSLRKDCGLMGYLSD
jgi:hypothetical protein